MATGTSKKVTNDSGSGYCKMPDGTLIQFGYASILAERLFLLLKFPTQFVNNSYAFTATPEFRDTRDVWMTYYDNSSNPTGSIYVYRNTALSTAQNFSWIAIGRWK
jgi:hypothetical protein